MEIAQTIIPIFSVILLGWLARYKGFMPAGFSGPANRLVYYIAIPAMIFGALAKGSLKTDFNPVVLGCTLGAVVLGCGAGWGVAWLMRIPRQAAGTFIQTTFHGNLGYIGLAVAFYALGQEGFTGASLLIGFIMILQNLMAVCILQYFGDASGHPVRTTLEKLLCNPIIISALAGIGYSLSGLPLPLIADRTLSIISGMALPLALLLIGAGLSLSGNHLHLNRVLAASAIKLLGIPAMGWGMYILAGLPAPQFVPGLILLASPSATVCYVMAMELNGDVSLAGHTISLCTLLSAVSFALWLHLTL